MDVAQLLALLEPEIVALRREIHSHPELGWYECSTQARIASFLKKHGYRTRKIGGTGLLTDLKGGAPQQRLGSRRPCLAIRADLDALPVTEQTGLEYASKNRGIMHTCGHDVHIAVVAGLAAVLARLARDLPGDIRFVFQPAEEGSGISGSNLPYPPGTRAAALLIQEGVLDGVDAIVGIHCWPDLPVGTLGIDPRTSMAGNATVRMNVLGRGGHGATPHKTADPVPMAATLILALQTIASRKSNPSNPFVLSIGSIHGGTAANVIPDSVSMAITLRSYTPGYLENEIPEIIKQMAHGIVEGMGGSVEMTYTPGLPPVINDKALVDLFCKSGEAASGVPVAVLSEAAMTSEDFAYYAQKIPGLYVKLGVAGEGGCAPLHSPFFDPDERCIAVGIKALARFAVDYLTETNTSGGVTRG